MQGAITTIQNVKSWVQANNTPYWRLFSGAIGSREGNLIMSQMTDGDIDKSLATLEQTLNYFNVGYGGTFNLLLSKDNNPKDNSGARVNITLGTENTGQTAKMAGIGSLSLDDMEARIEKAVAKREAELKKEFQHQAAIQGLKEEIKAIREQKTDDWTPERIGSVAANLASNPLVVLLVSKALGISGTDMVKIAGLASGTEGGYQAPTDVPDNDDEKIDYAIATIDEAGIGNTADVLVKLATFAKNNPDMAKNLLSNIPTGEQMTMA